MSACSGPGCTHPSHGHPEASSAPQAGQERVYVPGPELPDPAQVRVTVRAALERAGLRIRG